MSSETVPGEPLADPPSPKYLRAVVTLELGVPETWTVDGGKDRLIAELERVMGSNTSGVGPGNATMLGLFIVSFVPGSPDAQAAEEKLELMRHAYPLKLQQFAPGAEAHSETYHQGFLAGRASAPEPYKRDLETLQPGNIKITLYQHPPGYECEPDCDMHETWPTQPGEMHEPPEYPREGLEFRGGCHE